MEDTDNRTVFKHILVSTGELKKKLKKYLDLAQYEDQPVYIKRYGKVVAVILKATVEE